MTYRLYEVTLRRMRREVRSGEPETVLLNLDSTVEAEQILNDLRLYRALEGAVRRAGCRDMPGELPEYDIQLRERGGRDVVATFASHWRDPSGDRR